MVPGAGIATRAGGIAVFSFRQDSVYFYSLLYSRIVVETAMNGQRVSEIAYMVNLRGYAATSVVAAKSDNASRSSEVTGS